MVAVDDLDVKRERLEKLLECLSSGSSFRETLVFNLKRLLISNYALRYNFKKVMFGTNA